MNATPAKFTQDNCIEFRCPHCYQPKVIPAARLRERSHRLKVRCQCHNTVELHVEGRQRFRKATNLAGIFAGQRSEIDKYKIKKGPGEMGLLKSNCQISDLSLNGVGIQADGGQEFKVGQHLAVAFLLDNSTQSLIEKETIVRHVRKGHIGCSFVSKEPDANLGFYLL